MSGGTNFALTTSSPSPVADRYEGGTLHVTLPEINFDSPNPGGGALPGDGSYGDPIAGFGQINRQMADTQRAFSDATAHRSNEINAGFAAQNAARNADQRAQLNETAALSQALRAPLNQPPVTGPMLPPNFAETAQPPQAPFQPPGFDPNGPPPPAGPPPATPSGEAAAQAAGLAPAAAGIAAAPAEGLLAGEALAAAGNAAAEAALAAGRFALRAGGGAVGSYFLLGMGSIPNQQAQTAMRLGGTAFDPTPLAGQPAWLSRPGLSEGFSVPPPEGLTPPAAFTPLPGPVPGALPGFAPAPARPEAEGMTPQTADPGPIPGLAAPPPQGNVLPGFATADPAPQSPGLMPADPGLTGPQTLEQRGLTAPTGAVNGVPTGRRSTTEEGAGSDRKAQIDSENQVSDRLAALGYDVVQNPTRGPKPALTPERLADLGLDSDKHPDLLFGDRVFDTYTPEADNTRSIRNGVASKINDRQTDRIVLDLRGTTQTEATIRAALREEPVSRLKEIITIGPNGVGRAFP